MSLEEFMEAYGSYKNKPKELRFGQYLMNSLWHVRPDLYKELLRNGGDTFYLDSRIDKFWLFLDNNWNR